MSELVTTYLQDHHAGSSAGVEGFERVAEQHGDPEVRAAVARLAQQIREDQDSLQQIMDTVGASSSTIKDVAGWVGEKVARLKPNERIAERSPLSDVLELEALVMAVHAKGLLWKGLLAVDDERLDAGQLQRLADRADAQREELDRLRLGQIHKLRQH
ncbi:hypothetical protein [Luteococcus peritonei]|uniref:DUF892 family protein n=1 Tax=Luteococcus peritonei TaxID=88874 RepID=A0ABW4RWZ0_9ACTN